LHIYLNGESREVEDNLPVPELIRFLNLKPEQIAIELNKRVLRRIEWPETILRDADKVEIVHFVGGGGEPGAVSRGNKQEQEQEQEQGQDDQ
jgi:thiamine biosynthesis protein ThiS